MPSNLVFTIRFLQPYSHGRSDGSEPEWPPSPLRLLQALVAAAAARRNERLQMAYAVPALEWLEMLAPPVIVAAKGVASAVPTQFYVPDNTAELLVPAWKKGDMTKVPKRTEKVVRPNHLQGDAVHFVYAMPSGECPHLEVLKTAARAITHLGWGIDMVAADATIITQDEADKLEGHRWRTVANGGVPLRIPKVGSLADLMRKHQDFLHRLSDEGFRPVPPLQCFEVVRYHSPTVEVGPAPSLPLAAFEIHRTIDEQEAHPEKSQFRPFHHVRKIATVAGMVRHSAAAVLRQAGQPEEWINAHIHGHGDAKQGQSTSNERLQILPLPSITPVGLGGIRRVLLVGWPGFEIAPLRRLLNGQDLIDDKSRLPVATLAGLSTKEPSLQNYLRASSVWSTVTPVILPGFDDRDKVFKKLKQGVTAEEQEILLTDLHARTLNLIWKAFHNAGFTADALEGAQVEYRKVGWFQRLGQAHEYDLPPLHYPRYHLRIRFARPITGPLCVGAGRYRGFGLFAVDD